MIVITSTFTADVIHPQLTSLLPQIASEQIVFIYQNIFSQLLLAHSESQQNRSGLNVLLLRLSDIAPYSPAAKLQATEQFITEFAYILTTAHATMQVPLLILFTPTPAHLKEEAVFYANMAQQIQQHIGERSTLWCLQPSELLARYPQQYCAPFTDKYGHMPYALEFYGLLSETIVQHYALCPPISGEATANTLPTTWSKILPSSSSNRLLPHTEQMVHLHVLGLCKRHGLAIAQSTLPFIALGLDSLRAAQFSADILKAYHFSLNPLQLLAETMTLDVLYQMILQKLLAGTARVPTPELAPQTPITLPLSNAQKRLWYDEKISEGTNRNNLFIAYAIPKNCDISLLERAFNTLLARHDALRFSFHTAADEPMLTCHPADNLSLKIQQQTVADEHAIQHAIERFHQIPFDLSQAPLWRVAVVQSPNKTVLLFCIHHIIHDSWSLQILWHELSLLYYAYSHQLDPKLPKISQSYLDFIAWQQQYITQDLLATQKKYWQTLLHKLPMMAFKHEQPRKKWEDAAPNQRIEFHLEEKLSLQIRQTAAKHCMTVYDVLTSAFGLLLSHYTNQEDISFLTAVSGRHHSQFHPVIGFFVNLLLIRFHISTEVSWPNWLKTNKRLLNDIFSHQELPLHDILQVTGEMVNAKIHTFNQAGFIFQNHPTPQFCLHNEICQRVHVNNGSPLLYNASHEYRFGNLVCFMQDSDTGLNGLFEYNPALFQHDMLLEMIQAFKTLLTNITQDPTGPAKAIPVFTATQPPAFLHTVTPSTDLFTLNGYTIDPCVIETQLQTHPYVQKAVVVYNPTHPAHLAAYIVLDKQHKLSDINLYHHLKTHLPKYMLPKTYIQIDTVPLTATGTIDKSSLMTQSLPIVTYREYESSQSVLQDKIIAIFSKILHIDATLIGINASFFDLGGNSISALRLIQMLNDQFHISINFSLLYDHATVKLLSTEISDLLGKTQFTSLFTHTTMSEHTLKKVKPGSADKLPIIFIHPMGGTGCCYLDLIKVLPDDQPCYLIQDPSLDANQMLFDDMVSMATYYNHVLIKHFSTSPYILAGFGFGGLIAWEMLAQLEHKKLADSVHSLIAFDTWMAPNVAHQPISFSQTQDILHPESQPWMTDYYGRLQNLSLAYIPPKITKNIVLFKAMQERNDVASGVRDASNFLNLYTLGTIETHQILCDHATILCWPHIRSIGNLITQHILDSAHEYELN